MRRKRRILLGTGIASVLVATAAPVQAQAVPPARGSRGPLRVTMVVERQPVRSGDSGRIVVTLSATRPHPEAQLVVTFGGAAQPRPSPGYAVDTSAAPQIRGVGGARALRRAIAAADSTSDSSRIALDVRGTGIGYVVAQVAPVGGPHEDDGASVALYLLVTGDTVFLSEGGVEDARAAALADSLRRTGLPPDQVARRVRAFRRRAHTVAGSVMPPDTVPEEDLESQPASGPLALADGGNHETARVPAAVAAAVAVTVSGTVKFTDRAGVTHPVRFAGVDLYQDKSGPDQLLATTTTDADGAYVLSAVSGATGSVDVFVVVRAQNPLVTVQTYLGSVQAISSEPACPGPGCNVSAGDVVSLDLTAGNDETSPEDVAFSAYEAINYIARFLPDLGAALPSGVIVEYPGDDLEGSWYDDWSGTIVLATHDVLDWDNIHHEYGHFLQDRFGIPLPPVLSWPSDQNLCGLHGRGDGLPLAWGEAWPTFFALSAQREINLARAAAGLPPVTVADFDDALYTDTRVDPTNTLQYSLEVADANGEGEGNARAIMRTLWDLYDDVDDAGDVGVSLGAIEAWKLVTTAQPATFSGFWAALIAGRSEAERAALGAILAVQKIGPAPTGPPDGTVAGPGSIPTLQWTGNMLCSPDGNEQYSVRVYDAALTTLVYASPFQTATSFDLAPLQATVFAGPNGPLSWLVVGKDPTTPASGSCAGPGCPYYGRVRSIVDNITPATRGAVDIVLALDFSGSMGSVVPGSSTGLLKIDLLKQAVELFVETWVLHAIPGDRLGVVYFNSATATTAVVPPFLVDVTTQGSAVVADLLSRAQGGCTAMGGALQVAYDNLGGNSNKRVIILFSDGIQTANPFVIEEGSPARLRVATVAAGDPLPFGSFRCTGSPATAPDGSVVVPDGRFLDEHDVEVHTIGVGVSGVAFAELIERIAGETGALHHFTDAPDADLDTFFTDDLVASLQTGSLQTVLRETGTLAASGIAEFVVPVNPTAKLLTLVLSWRSPPPGSDTVDMTVLSSDGAVATPSRARQGGFYRLVRFDLGDADLPTGDWRVRLRRSAGGSPSLYQLSAVVDEPCLDVALGLPGRHYTVGEPIPLTVALTHDGRPWAGSAAVSVDVTSPALPARNVLARRLAGIPAWTIQPAQTSAAVEPQTPRLHRAIQLAMSDSTLVRSLSATRANRMSLLDDGLPSSGDRIPRDGIYTGAFRPPGVPGPHHFRVSIRGVSACGYVTRSMRRSIQVRPGPASPARSPVTAVALTEQLYLVRVLPADARGNLVGLGAATVNIVPVAGRRVGPVDVRPDGSYQQLVLVPDGGTSVLVSVDGDPVRGGPLARLVTRDAVVPRDTLAVLAVQGADPRGVRPGTQLELLVVGSGFGRWPHVAFVDDGVVVTDVTARSDQELVVEVRVRDDAAPGTHQMVVATDGRAVVREALLIQRVP